MQALAITIRDKSNARLVGVGILGCLLAVVIGVAAATDQGVLVAGVVLGLAFCGIAIAVYSRDPVGALIWLWIIEVFDAPLSATFGYFSSTGEIIRQAVEFFVLLFVFLTFWRTVQTNTRLPPLRFILPGIGVALFGVIGAGFHHVPLTITITGAWLGLKLWLMVVFTLLLPWKLSDATRIYTILTGIGLFVAAFGLVDYATHAALSKALGTSIYTFTSETARGEAVHSFLPHPGEFSLFMSLLFALSFSRFAVSRNKADLMLALLFAGSVMLSLRLKGFLSLVAVALIIALVQGLMHNRGAVVVLLIGSLLLVGAYSVEGNVIDKQISTYASSETSARARLYTTGEQIAIDNFPLGAGFGRFASYASRIYYSPVYYQYELNSVFGLSRKFPNFIDDTSWPAVIGETGLAGFLVYLVGIVLLIGAIIGRLRKTAAEWKWVPLSALCAMAAILIDSLGEATLFDWLAATIFALILGPAMIANKNASDGDEHAT